MLLDWFTIFAQVLNFFVLIALLRLFLYKPIVGAMQERKEHVAQETLALREARAESQSLNMELRRKREDLDNREAEVMAEIHAEAERLREQAMDSARGEVETMRREWLAALEREKESVALNLRKKLIHEVSATAARIVQDLSGSDLEQLILSGFMQRIDDEARGVDCGNSEILIRTGFEHTELQEQNLKKLLDELFPSKNERIFTTDPRLGLGIELIAGDRKWEWNLSSYVTELENKILTEINS
ncbi:ATPase [Maridesulfovibrio salexigens]|uniref:ATP synthase subunit b n=1 Tax=Maridesulfovibrio salexigens (strain ATCC 14822 / DSM 2638 / NCIMB 8403 / VKM B-1763) TaxID=526222 RepID=C6BWK8_MARSD|nr:ATPase [Maridesulfovibrio salexigens]ACS80288.1 H+transporting two-sector ATPase B/B' subunit [Maridesulfovibrio salexigens DSM 2638]